jgi:hypothetical protein
VEDQPLLAVQLGLAGQVASELAVSDQSHEAPG